MPKVFIFLIVPFVVLTHIISVSLFGEEGGFEHLRSHRSKIVRALFWPLTQKVLGYSGIIGLVGAVIFYCSCVVFYSQSICRSSTAKFVLSLHALLGISTIGIALS